MKNDENDLGADAAVVVKACPLVPTDSAPHAGVSTVEAVELMMNAGAYDALNRLEELITGLELPHATEKALFKGISDLYEGMSQLVKDAVVIQTSNKGSTT